MTIFIVSNHCFQYGVREGIRPTAIDTESIACSPTKGGAQQSCGVRSTRSNRKRKPNREVGAGVREGIRPTAIDTESIACSPTKGGAQQSCGVRSTCSNRKRKPNREVGTGVREGIRTPDLRFRKLSLYPIRITLKSYLA